MVWTCFVAIVVLAVFAVLFYANRYRKVPPLSVMIVFGPGKKMGESHPQFVIGGGKLILPFSKVRYLDTDVRTLEVRVIDVPVKNDVPTLTLHVGAVTQVRVAPDPGSLKNAVRHFLDKPRDEVDRIARMYIEKAMTEVISGSYIEDLNRDRDAHGSRIQALADKFLKEFGIEIRSFVIKELDDSNGYLEAWGWARTFEVKVQAGMPYDNLREDYSRIVIDLPERFAKEQACIYYRMGRSIEERTDGLGSFHCYAMARGLDPGNKVYEDSMNESYERLVSRLAVRGYRPEGDIERWGETSDLSETEKDERMMRQLGEEKYRMFKETMKRSAAEDDRLGVVLLERNELMKALNEFNQARNLDPDEPSYSRHREETLERIRMEYGNNS